jgi:hypothetical protein
LLLLCGGDSAVQRFELRTEIPDPPVALHVDRGADDCRRRDARRRGGLIRDLLFELRDPPAHAPEIGMRVRQPPLHHLELRLGLTQFLRGRDRGWKLSATLRALERLRCRQCLTRHVRTEKIGKLTLE